MNVNLTNQEWQFVLDTFHKGALAVVNSLTSQGNLKDVAKFSPHADNLELKILEQLKEQNGSTDQDTNMDNV